MKKSNVEKGLLAFIFLTAAFALLSVLARYLNNGFTILQQVYFRVFVALLLATIVFYRQLDWKKIMCLRLREWLVLAFRGFIGYGVAVTLISKAATMTLLGNVSFIAALPFVPLLGFIFLKEKVTWWKLLFIFGSVLGVALLAVHNLHDIFSWGAGDVIAIIATLAFAISYVTRRWHSEVLNNQEITTLTFAFGFLVVFLMSLGAGEGVPPLGHPWDLWLVIGLGGVLNVVNLFLLNYAFEHVDAVRGGNLLNLESAWGLLFGLVFYHEWPSLRGLIGGILIVACVVGMNLYSRRELATIAPLRDESGAS